jgi:hypothetical protein
MIDTHNIALVENIVKKTMLSPSLRVTRRQVSVQPSAIVTGVFILYSGKGVVRLSTRSQGTGKRRAGPHGQYNTMAVCGRT